MMKINIQWTNWRVWAQNMGFVLGGFIAGGLTVVNWQMPAKPIVTAKGVQTVAVDTRAAAACVASLDEIGKLRKEFDVCKPKPTKAAVK